MLLDGFYEVIQTNENEVFVKLCDATHKVFQAHFPDKPILPGFVHLDIIEDVFNIEIIGIKKAKYSALVFPSQTLQYIRSDDKIKVICEEKEVATFILVM